MPRYKVTILMPHEREFDAANTQEAHNKVTKMMQNYGDPDANPGPKVHSIVEIPDPEPINFEIDPE